jgi:hypothetical protein
MESYMFFGILGALVSGKIAAIAVQDKARAADEFKLATSSFASAYVAKKLSNLAPHSVQKVMMPLALRHAFDYPRVAETVKRAMPGWKNITR